MKKVYSIEEYCVGCGLCEVHCITAHSKSKDIIKAYKKENNRPVSRVIMEDNQPLSFALQCRHCEDSPCVKACITGGMQRDKETGIVTCNEDKCVGCWTCILVCPFGVIERDYKNKKVASKCDLCSDLDMPACVKNCPNGALKYK